MGCFALTASAQGYAGTPFNGPHTVPCVVQAEDFDEGGEGISYHDAAGLQNDRTINLYRPDNNDVEIADEGDNDGYHIGWTAAGEWYCYTVDVAEAEVFDFEFTWAIPDSGITMTLSIDDVEAGTAVIPNTGSYNVYGRFTIPDVALHAGSNVVKITLNHGNFDKFAIKKKFYCTPHNGPHTVPGVIEAEDYDDGGEGVAYHDLEPGHQGGGTIALRPEEGVEIESGPDDGYHIGWTNSGEWLNYTVEAAATDIYSVVFTWAIPSAGHPVEVFANGIPAGSANVPVTGSYDTYGTFAIGNVALTEGINVITVKLEHGNFDKFEVKKYAGTPYTDYEGSNDEAIVLPGLIEAEYFDNGGQDVAYHTSTPEAGGATNSIRQTEVMPINNDEFYGDFILLKNKDWASYTVNSTVEEDFHFLYSVLLTEGEGSITYYIDDSKAGTVNISAHEEWQFPELHGQHLTTGQFVFKFEYTGTGTLRLGDVFVTESNVVQKPITDFAPDLYFDFQSDDFTAPTIGSIPLEFYTRQNGSIGTPLSSYDPAQPTRTDGPAEGDLAIAVPRDVNIKVGNPGDKPLTGYTILYDLRFPFFSSEATGYHCLLQCNPDNNDDGDIFVNWEARIGQGNYSGFALEANQWYRIIIVYPGGNTSNIYADGKFIHTPSGNKISDIQDYFWIFADEDGEDDDQDIANLAFWTRILSEEEIEQLGNAFHETTAISKLTDTKGRVYADNGKLRLEGFSKSASVEVFTVAGQRVASLKSNNGRTVSLPASGLYIVRVNDKGTTAGFKVLAK